MVRHEPQGCSIADLRDCRLFFDTVAKRIWQTWFREAGYPLAHIEDQLERHMGSGAIPFVFVAFRSSAFLGTATIVTSVNLDSQPYTPSLIHVLVEEGHRRRGIGTALIDQAAERTFSLGLRQLYLTTARKTRRSTRGSAGNPYKTMWARNDPRS